MHVNQSNILLLYSVVADLHLSLNLGSQGPTETVILYQIHNNTHLQLHKASQETKRKHTPKTNNATSAFIPAAPRLSLK